jgi:hypothetical protein
LRRSLLRPLLCCRILRALRRAVLLRTREFSTTTALMRGELFEVHQHNLARPVSKVKATRSRKNFSH